MASSTTDNPVLHWLFTALKLISKVFSGIVGNAQHARQGGYHIGRNFQPPGNYSTSLVRDRGGDGDVSCAIDVSFAQADMITATTRLINAARSNDPRMRGVREINGTLNGRVTVNYDVTLGGQNYTPDSTHLWHVHLGLFRDTAQVQSVAAGIADVINGVPLGQYRPATGNTTPIEGDDMYGDADRRRDEITAKNTQFIKDRLRAVTPGVGGDGNGRAPYYLEDADGKITGTNDRNAIGGNGQKAKLVRLADIVDLNGLKG